MADMPDLDGLLSDGGTVAYLGKECLVSRRDAGTLVLPSGQVVVRDERVVAWEPAEWRDGNPAAHANYYAVDRGTACFMDLVAARALDAWDEDKVDEVLVNRLLNDGTDIVVQQIDPGTGANVIISDCGGDGACGVWIGRTADGDVACFVTDLVVADSPDDD